MSGIIYKIENTVNGKKYIGSTQNKKQRWGKHKRDLKAGRHSNDYLQRAWDKYGSDNFRFEVIEKVPREDKLLEREQWYLDNTETEYNLAIDAQAAFRGLSHTEESIRKIRESHMGAKNPMYNKSRPQSVKQSISKTLKGREFSDETRKKLSESSKGKKMSKSARKKMSKQKKGKNNPHYGRQRPKEVREKISKAQIGGKNHYSKLNSKKVKIIKHLLEGGKFFQREIAKMFGVHEKTISAISVGRTWTHINITRVDNDG